MKLRPDDDIYRARLVYLGPPGYPLPFHLPYAQYGLFAVLCAVLGGGTWLLTGSSLWAAWAVAVAVFLTGYIWTHVDPDRPVTRVLKVVALDWRRTATQTDALPRLTATHVRIRDGHDRDQAVVPSRVAFHRGAVRPVAASITPRTVPVVAAGHVPSRPAARDDDWSAPGSGPARWAVAAAPAPRPRVVTATVVHREIPPPGPVRIRRRHAQPRTARHVVARRRVFVAALVVLGVIGAVGFSLGWGIL
jgi:hypothetical protein